MINFSLNNIPVLLMLALMLSTGWGRPAVAGDTRELTLTRALSMALAYNQDVKIAENQVATSEISKSQGRSDFLPGLSASAGWALGRKTRSLDNTYESMSAALSASVNVFNGFADTASLQKSEYTLASDRDSLVRTRQTVIFKTIQAYLNTLSSREQIRVARENLGDNEAQLKQIEAFCKVGRRPLTDLYQQQAEMAGARLELVTAQQAYEVNTMELKEIIGISVLTPLTVADSFDEMEIGSIEDSPAVIMKEALEKRADLFAVQNQVRATDMAIREASAGYYPSVDLVAELGSSYSSLDDSSSRTQWTDDNVEARVGVSVSVPIFDRYLTRNQVSQAKIASRTIRYEQEKLIRQVEVEIGQAFSEYRAAESKLDVSRAQEQYASRALASTRQRYESGSATLTELTTARTSYVQARYDSVEASLNRIIQAVSLSFYRGDMDGFFQAKEVAP